MDRWRGVLKVPLHPLAGTCYLVAASLCLFPTSETLVVPSANAVLFGGDRVAGTVNPVIERLSDLRNIAEILVSKISGSVSAWVIEASDFNGTSYHLLINGESQSYCPVGYPASGSIVSLLSSFLEEVKNKIVRQKELSSPGISTSDLTQPKTLLFGFSKGGTVLNQIVTELGFSDIEFSGGELMEEKKISIEEEIHVIPRTKETLLKSIREIHYVDVGLNSPGVYITDHSSVEKSPNG